MVSAVIIMLGYQYEYFVGTGPFLQRFLTVHGILIGCFSYFGL